MEYSYCPNCKKETGHKRALGWGTFFGAIFTFGFSLFLIPFYPIRCIICGSEEGKGEANRKVSADTKICPQCAEEVKAAAKICRFCRYEFPEEVKEEITPKVLSRTCFKCGKTLYYPGELEKGICKSCQKQLP